jgi:hypothetical protein
MLTAKQNPPEPQKQSIYISSVDLKLYKKLKIHLKKTGIAQNFFISQAIAEKLKRDSKSDEK